MPYIDLNIVDVCSDFFSRDSRYVMVNDCCLRLVKNRLSGICSLTEE